MIQEAIDGFIEDALNLIWEHWVFILVTLWSVGVLYCLYEAGKALVKTCKEKMKQSKERKDKAWVGVVETVTNILMRHAKVTASYVVDTFKADREVCDRRPKLVGTWYGDYGTEFEIGNHEGYYTLKFTQCRFRRSLEGATFILRDVQGWLHDDNVYMADGAEYFTLGVSDNNEEIFVSELGCKFTKEPPLTEAMTAFSDVVLTMPDYPEITPEIKVKLERIAKDGEDPIVTNILD